MSLLCGATASPHISRLEMKKYRATKSAPNFNWGPLLEFRRNRELEQKRKLAGKEGAPRLPRLVRKSPHARSAASAELSKLPDEVVATERRRSNSGTVRGSMQSLLDPVDYSSLSEHAKDVVEQRDTDSPESRRRSLAEKLNEKVLSSKPGLRRTSEDFHGSGHRPHIELVQTPSEAFHRTQKYGGVSVGAPLTHALCMLGHQFPNLDYIGDILRIQVRGRESLDEADFNLVVESYEEQLRRFLQGVMVADTCRKDSVPELMSEAGVPFMLGALDEITKTFPSDEDEEVDVDGFRGYYLNTFQKAGLTYSEYQRIVAYFRKHKDGKGMLPFQHCMEGLKWHDSLVSLAGGDQVLQAIANACLTWSRKGMVDLNPRAWAAEKTAETLLNMHQKPAEYPPGGENPDGVTLGSFLAGARTLHELINKGLQRVYLKMGKDPSTSIPTSAEQLSAILEEVGFCSVVPSSVQVFMDMTTFSENASLSFDEVYSLLLQYSLANGITPSERREIEDLFIRFDDDGSGTLDASEIGPLIRWLGYQPSKYRVYDFCEGFGIKEDSEINLEEFVELVTKYQEYSLKLARATFYPSPEHSQSQVVGVGELGELLRVVGYDPSETEIEELEKSTFTEAIDFAVFKQLEATHRKHVIRCMETNGGLTDPEIAKHQQYFEDHDPQRAGFISNDALRKLFATLFPDKLQDKEFHLKIGKMIKEADSDGNGKFDFEEYVGLMKEITKEVDRDILLQGLKLGPELGYSRDEVTQLRDLYRAADEDMSGEIDYEELKELFGKLVEMSSSAEEELREMYLEVDDGDERMDFWEFMKFMKSIQDKNWQNINGD